MDPTQYFGQDILAVLQHFRTTEEICDYAKVDDDEFLKLEERGFYLHAKHGTGVICDCRIYFAPDEAYFPAAPEARGRFAAIARIADLDAMLGAPVREIRSLQIPGRPPTRPGREYRDGGLSVRAYHDEGGAVIHLHLSQAAPEGPGGPLG